MFSKSRHVLESFSGIPDFQDTRASVSRCNSSSCPNACLLGCEQTVKRSPEVTQSYNSESYTELSLSYAEFGGEEKGFSKRLNLIFPRAL